ncbi:MAG: hypothetical protein LBC50_01340 [Candidatus Ancillula sp.]|jgi:hypothetical protein|nr:hypothetical protein [Candidatus Ancillula sp.]
MKSKIMLKVIISVCFVLALVAVGVIVFVLNKPPTADLENTPTSEDLTEDVSLNVNYDYTKMPTLAWSKGNSEYILLDYTGINKVESGVVVLKGSGSTDGTIAVRGANPRTGDVVWEKDVKSSANCTPISGGQRITCISPNRTTDSPDREDAEIEIIDAETGEPLKEESSLCALIDCVESINIDNIQVVSAKEKIIIFGSLGRNSESLFFYAFNSKDLSTAYRTIATHLSEGVKGGDGSAMLLHNSRYLVGSVGEAFHVLDAESGKLVQSYEPGEPDSHQFAECHPGPFDDSYTCSELNMNDDMEAEDGNQTVYRDDSSIHTAELVDFNFSTSTPIEGWCTSAPNVGVVAHGEVIDHDGNALFTPATPADSSIAKLTSPLPYSNVQYQTCGNVAFELYGAGFPGAPLAAYSLPESSGQESSLLWDLTPQLNPPDSGANWYENTSAYLVDNALIAGLRGPDGSGDNAGLAENIPNTPTAFNASTGDKLWELPKTVDNARNRLFTKRGYVIIAGTIVTQDSDGNISGYTFSEQG